ncbi:MAG: hypothetical protein PHE59_05040 [Patescibacteria group bacterium]|nr:hypothetical protein [Patescibacteria group bacterium]
MAEMTQEQLEKFIVNAEKQRRKLPCPVRPEGCGGTGQGRCRFMVPAITAEEVNPRIQVVGDPGPPKINISWECQFDLMREEISQMHFTVGNIMALLASAVRGPAPVAATGQPR